MYRSVHHCEKASACAFCHALFLFTWHPSRYCLGDIPIYLKAGLAPSRMLPQGGLQLAIQSSDILLTCCSRPFLHSELWLDVLYSTNISSSVLQAWSISTSLFMIFSLNQMLGFLNDVLCLWYLYPSLHELLPAYSLPGWLLCRCLLHMSQTLALKTWFFGAIHVFNAFSVNFTPTPSPCN